MPKIMHGSVSLPPIDQLAAQFVVLAKSDVKMFDKSPEADQLNYLYEEIHRRVGRDYALIAVENARKAYDLLTGD